MAALARAITRLTGSFWCNCHRIVRRRLQPRIAAWVRSSRFCATAGIPFARCKLKNTRRVSSRRTPVRARGPKKPPPSIRYLLSADRRLQRLSLRRISARVTKGKKSPRSARSKVATPEKGSMRFPWVISSRAIAFAVIGVMVAAVLIAARQPSPPALSAGSDGGLETVTPLQQVAVSTRPETKKPVASKPAAAEVVARTSPTNASIDKTTAVESARPKTAAPASITPAVESASKAAPIESTLKVLPAEPTPKAAVQDASSVTISGCLANDEGTFWLKDTSGADAPKARSWKSGFLKKRPAAIELVDETNTLRLAPYVGQRVSATGVLMNRGMRAQSLRRIGGSCS